LEQDARPAQPVDSPQPAIEGSQKLGADAETREPRFQIDTDARHRGVLQPASSPLHGVQWPVLEDLVELLVRDEKAEAGGHTQVKPALGQTGGGQEGKGPSHG
jgi:hypothetical protein